MPYTPEIPLDTRQNNLPASGEWLWRMMMMSAIAILIMMSLRLAERLDEIGMDVLSIGTEQQSK